MMKRKRSSGGKVLVSSSTKTKTPKERSMNETKYMGMDVHKAMTVIAVLNGVGKTVAEAIIETKARTILDFIKSQRGTLHVAFEEGTQAAWLYDLIRPYVASVRRSISRARDNSGWGKTGGIRPHRRTQSTVSVCMRGTIRGTSDK